MEWLEEAFRQFSAGVSIVGKYVHQEAGPVRLCLDSQGWVVLSMVRSFHAALD